jgi:aldehyde dehydrogenase (NAD+)
MTDTAVETPTYGHFIAGEWCDSTGGATFESRNPADVRDVIGRFQQGTAADVGMAIRAADMARCGVRRLRPSGRIQHAFGARSASTRAAGGR